MTSPTPRGRPRSGVREAILRAAEEVLAESGVARLSTKEIAARAGVAESSIFYHFRDRLGLLRAVIQTRLPEFKELTERLRDRAGHGELRDNLVALLESLERLYERVGPILAAVRSDSELRALFAGHTAEGGELIGPLRAVAPIVAYLEEERDRGRIAPGVDLESFAVLLIGAAQQAALYRDLTGSTQWPGGGASHLVDALLCGLRAG